MISRKVRYRMYQPEPKSKHTFILLLTAIMGLIVLSILYFK
ncbi:MAG: hypothetical protein R3328_06105 [Planococcaceae bacterium]|nr:hypothetical protein [Planococcaceae bacterium]